LKSLFENIVNEPPNMVESFDENLKTLLLAMLEKDSRMRPSISDIFNTSYI